MNLSLDDAEAEPAVRHIISRHFFGTATGVAWLVAALFAVVPAGGPTGTAAGAASGPHWLLVLVFGALGGFAASRMYVIGKAQVDRGVALVGVIAVAAIALASALLGWGVASPGVGFLGLLSCLVCAVAGWRAGALVAGLSVCVIVGLSLAQQWQWPVAGHGVLGDDSLWLRTAMQLALVAAGLAGGMLVSRLVARHLRSARQREQRFRGLLTIAADAYWEIDDRYRFVTLELPRRGAAGVPGLAAPIGKLPWELPQLGLDDDALDLLRAQLEAREPLRDLLVPWCSAGAQLRHVLVSAEPRYRARGVFNGYWGVARDVSAEVQARQALRATESRYQELFTHIPTPLVLHAHARVLDANPAALAMFGFAELDAMLGHDLLAAYEPGDSRQRARGDLAALQRLPAGEALPVAEYHLAERGGRRAVVRATSVRLDPPDAAAALSIFVDDTERKKAEDAVRRSEALLSHLVASSPDVITLSEMASGRFAMVNRNFERHSGYSAAEVVGRSALELGIWHEPHERQRFMDAVRSQGHVQDVPIRFVDKGGAVLSMRVSGACFTMDRREYLVINARDVTEAERERLQREAILHNASVGIAVTRERHFVLANPRFEQIYGWPVGTLLGQSARVVWDSDDEYLGLGATLGPVLARGEAVELETWARRFDDSSFLARITGKAIDPSLPGSGGTIWIVDDITERRQVEQALAQARDAAEDANRAKSAFLANTSHELRTPLNALIGLAQLAAGDAGEAQRRQHLQQIAQTAQALSAIISDILDLSKIEAGRMVLEHTAFDLGELLRDLQRTYAPLAQAQGLTLQLDVADGVAGFVGGDALRIRQILSNYLNNALRFGGGERAQLRLTAARIDAERVRFEVHDNGAGIDEATQARLFKPFSQADESTTRRYGGTGLGLSICRELAALMAGQVGVASRIGAGSCFWAELPLAAVSAPPPPPVAAAPAPDALFGASLLVVEDNAVNMLITTTLLRQWGAQVEEAGDGEQAVQAVRRRALAGEPFDAVVMDVQMPVMGGHEAARLLRAEFGAEQLPIIALTAAALVSEREQALAAGMNDFLTKPIEAQRLRQVLARWIAQSSPGRPETARAPLEPSPAQRV